MFGQSFLSILKRNLPTNTDEESLKKLSAWVSEVSENTKATLQAEHGRLEENGTTMVEETERLKEDVGHVGGAEETETKLAEIAQS